MENIKLDNRYFPLLLDVIDQGIFAINNSGVITFFNRAAESITGFRAEEIIGQRCSSIFRTELCHTECPLQLTIASGKRIIDRRVRIKIKDGYTIPVSISTALLQDNGRILGGVEVIKDLSPMLNLKRQLDGKYKFEDIISKNEEMHQIFTLLPKVARSDATVLILGASGTGKELIAKAIHHQSPRKDEPFVAVNCAAMPETLMESELFGYTKGAFTGALRDKPGRIAQADGGSLFLDEIGDLSLQIQVKLLRFLQDRSYEPLGATYTARADVRIISATNRDLEDMVRDGSFRKDLYFRLNIMQIHLPPLSKRMEDVPLLIRHFIRHFRSMTGKKIEGMEDEALEAMVNYPYPGNIRELENIIERAFILCEGPLICLDHLPPPLLRPYEREKWTDIPEEEPSIDLNPIGLAERDAILGTLKRNGGNRTLTARELGIHRTTLFRKLRKYGLNGEVG